MKSRTPLAWIVLSVFYVGITAIDAFALQPIFYPRIHTIDSRRPCESSFIGRKSRRRNSPPPLFASYSSSILPKIVSLCRGGEGVGEVSELMFSAYEWCTNLGAPAALVAGAVVATIYETMNSGDLNVRPKLDSKWVQTAKKVTRSLLLSAFALEVLSIFVTTITGTMLLSRPVPAMASIVAITQDTTPLSFLRDNFEFEYLTARITFLQGLLNWLAAIGMTHAIPNTTLGRDDDASDVSIKSTRRMNKFVAASLFTTIVLMISFYNYHLTFYDNYWHMITRWMTVTFHRFVWRWPPRPLSIILIPSFSFSIYLGIRAFATNEVTEDAKSANTTSSTET